MPVVDRAINLAWVRPRPDILSSSDSKAPHADRLLGLATNNLPRAVLPSVIDMVTRADAAVRGFVRDPLHAARERDRLLAAADKSFDLQLEGGAQLRALQAMSGFFEVHLRPAPGDYDSSTIQLSLPEANHPEDAKVRAHVHAPDAAVGLHNAPEAARILAATAGVLRAALDDPDTARVDRFRAADLMSRIEAVQGHVASLCATLEAHPALAAALDVAARSAYATRRPGDAADTEFVAAMSTLRAVGPGLPAAEGEQLGRDLEILQADHDKWLAYHQDGISSFYVRRTSLSAGL